MENNKSVLFLYVTSLYIIMYLYYFVYNIYILLIGIWWRICKYDVWADSDYCFVTFNVVNRPFNDVKSSSDALKN